MKTTGHLTHTVACTFDTAAAARLAAIAGLFALVTAALLAPASAQSARAHATPAQATQHAPRPIAATLHTAPASVVTAARKPHAPPVERRIVDAHGVATPHGPGPRSEGGKHAIIFVGGHARNIGAHDQTAIHARAVSPGHALRGSPPSRLSKTALNPQPIPPGHALHSLPHPAAPIEKKIAH